MTAIQCAIATVKQKERIDWSENEKDWFSYSFDSSSRTVLTGAKSI
jgi:hypothetical protein